MNAAFSPGTSAINRQIISSFFSQERRAAHLEEQLAAAIAEKEHFRVSYEAVLSSACWKLTAPLRAFLGRKK